MKNKDHDLILNEDITNPECIPQVDISKYHSFILKVCVHCIFYTNDGNVGCTMKDFHKYCNEYKEALINNS